MLKRRNPRKGSVEKSLAAILSLIERRYRCQTVTMSDNAGCGMDTETPDPELMERVRSGDQDAFVRLIHRHQQSLVNFFRRLGAYSDAEDLAQETFLRVFRYRFKYRPVAKFTTFLYTVARHVWADGLRKTMRHEAISERVANESLVSDDGAIGHTQAAMDTQMALEKLSEEAARRGCDECVSGHEIR